MVVKIKYKVLAVLVLLVALVLSGCIYENLSPMEGWDQTRYDEYSELYYSIYEYNLSPAYTSAEIQQRIGDAQDKTFKIQSFYVNTVQKDTEFERAWFSAFSNYILGLNAEIVSYQKQKNLGEGRRVIDSTRNPDVPPEEIFIKGGFEDTQEAKEWREKAHFHFNKSLEYRKLIEDANPFHQANTLVIKTPNTIESSSSPTPKVTPTPQATPATSPTLVVTSSYEQNTINNSIGMEFVQIPAGEFEMGSQLSEKGRHNNEGPVHRVKIANDFYIGKYEVTQKQWRDVMGANPSKFIGDNLPVESVSWNDVQEFIKKLNEKEGTNKYRLPSEAEWEYAVRANTNTRYFFGDDSQKLHEYAWVEGGSLSLEGGTKAVGRIKPNPWGLYDMYGNVWEWVQDKYHSNYSGAPSDSIAWESEDTTDRVIRGCGWYSFKSCRSAVRNSFSQAGHSGDLGFRLVRICRLKNAISVFAFGF
jgi:formylglycine-generating enzyme required for sulfatase activity